MAVIAHCIGGFFEKILRNSEMIIYPPPEGVRINKKFLNNYLKTNTHG